MSNPPSKIISLFVGLALFFALSVEFPIWIFVFPLIFACMIVLLAFSRVRVEILPLFSFVIKAFEL